MQEQQENTDTTLRNLGTALLLGLFFLVFSSLRDKPVSAFSVASHQLSGSEMQVNNPAAITQENTHTCFFNHRFNLLPSQGSLKPAGEVHPVIWCSNHTIALILKQQEGCRFERRPFLHQKHCPHSVHQNTSEPPVLI